MITVESSEIGWPPPFAESSIIQSDSKLAVMSCIAKSMFSKDNHSRVGGGGGGEHSRLKCVGASPIF